MTPFSEFNSSLSTKKLTKYLLEMAKVVLLLLAVFFFLCFVDVSTVDGQVEDMAHGVVKGANRRLMNEIDCEGRCGERCSVHSRKNVCMRACGTCCSRCKCVPPGTSGNREQCGPCYTDMVTHGNKTKCP